MFDKEKDFTIFIDFDGINPSSGEYGYLISVGKEQSVYTSNLAFGYHEGSAHPTFIASGDKTHTWEDIDDNLWGHSWANMSRIALVFVNGVFAFGNYIKKDDPTNIRYIHAADGASYHVSNDTLIIGAKWSFWYDNTMIDFWKGTVNEFRIYDCAFAEEEVNAILLDE